MSASVNAILMADLRCEREHHPEEFWARRLMQNAAHQITLWCPQCRRPVTTEKVAGTKGHYVTAAWLKETYGLIAADLPEVKDCVRINICTLCRQAALCEYHHVATRAIYGSDADKFPLVPLCRPCHHRVTTQLEDYIERRIATAILRVTA